MHARDPLERSTVHADPASQPPRPPRAGGHQVRVAHLDTTAVVSAGLRALLSPYRDRITFTLDQSRADVLVADMSGIQHALTIPRLTAPLVVLARADDLAQLRSSGAHGLLLSASGAELLAAVETAHRVGRAAIATVHAVVAGEGGVAAPLSARERQVLDGICRGLSNDELAAILFVSVNSIKTYIRSAYRKIGVERRGQAIVWGLGHGFGRQDAPAG